MALIKDNKGFTLIELVMVIVILGILAAVAVPRFQDMSAQAHDAAVDGIVAGVSGGIGIFQAQSLIGTVGSGGSAGTNSFPVDLDGLGVVTASTSNLFFLYVLAQGISADWSKGTGAPLTADGSVTYTYTAPSGTDPTCSYTNNTGTFVRTN